MLQDSDEEKLTNFHDFIEKNVAKRSTNDFEDS